MNHYLSIIMALISLTCFEVRADQESQKSRLDDCFRILADFGAEMNANFGDNQAPYSMRFSQQQQRCLAQKTEFEGKYGSYSLPPELQKLSPSQAQIDKELNEFNLWQDRKIPDLVPHEICSKKEDLKECNKNPKKFFWMKCSDISESIQKLHERYKRAFNKNFNINRCNKESE